MVITTAGGTRKPRLSMRATDQALPPIRSRLGSVAPSSAIMKRPNDVAIDTLLFLARAAQHAQEIFVQFEPHGVIAG